MSASERRLALLGALVIPALGLSALVLDPTGWPFWRAGQFSDLWISHLPNLHFIRQALATWRSIPLWNPLILSGMPLAADPLAGLWYPPHVLGWLGPGGLGVNLLIWLHLSLAAAGVMALLRSEGASIRAAVLGGLAFAVTPKLIGHVGLGHLTLVEAVCWTPWVLVCVRRASDHALDGRERWRRVVMLGAILGLTFLIDPRWIVPLGLLTVAYVGKCIAHSQERRARGRQFLVSSPIALAVGAAIAAPLALPLVEFVGRTTRALMTAEEATSLALAPSGIVGAVLLRPGAWPETQPYVGTTVLVAVAAAFAAAPSRHRFWMGALVAGVILAFGLPADAYALLMRVFPALGLIRVPARFLLVTALSASMLVGHASDTLPQLGADLVARRRARLGTLLFVGVVVTLAVAAGIAVASQVSQPPLVGWAPMVAAMLAAGTAGIVFRLTSASAPSLPAGPAILAALIALDLGWANVLTLETRSLPNSSDTNACVTTGAALRFGDGRTFSPSYSLPQPGAADCAVELADGVNPLQLKGYRDYMASATGFQALGYSVTLPPFADGDPTIDWHPSIDAELLGRLSVERIVAAYPIEADGLTLLSGSGGAWVYANELARPRAWVEPEGMPGGNWRPVESSDWSPNRIRVRASGPGRLVLSEVDYPGWHARLDGAAVPISLSDGLLRAVDLPSGLHEVEFTFRPTTTIVGVGLAVLALLLLAVLWVRR